MATLTDEFNPTIFKEIQELWTLTGIGRPERGDDAAMIQATLAGEGKIFSLLNGGQVIGTAWLTHDHRRVYLHHMAVHPDFQGKGLGKRLMEAALAYADQLGLQVKLEVAADNIVATGLYRRFGFTPLEGYVSMIRRKPAPGPASREGGGAP